MLRTLLYSSLLKNGSWVFWSLCVFCLEFSLTVHVVVQFLCILLLKERCVQVQALQQRIPDPSLSQQQGMSNSVNKECGGEQSTREQESTRSLAGAMSSTVMDLRSRICNSKSKS